MNTRILPLLAGLVAGSAAMAADIPSRTTPAAPAFRAVPTFVWTGFYAGLNAGGGFGTVRGTISPLVDEPAGFIGGGQIGYNHQIDRFVVGLEADLAWANLRAGASPIAPAGTRSTLDFLGTVRGRVGYAMIDRFLPYATAGFAYGGSSVRVPGLGSSSPTHVGWTVGGGLEYAITNNFTAKVEGLYVNLNRESVVGGAFRNGYELGIFRAGVNYKF